MIPQLDVHTSAGGGSEETVEIGAEGAVIAHWHVPAHILRQFTPGPAEGLYWLTNRGTSMEPVIGANTPVLVDTKDRGPSPPAIYVVFDGFGLVTKYVEPIAHSNPGRVRISSANPAFQPYERTLEEAFIQGRVIANVKAT